MSHRAVSTAPIAAMVTGPRRQYAPLYRYCQVSSILRASRPMRSGTTCSDRYAATASSRPFTVASPRPLRPSSVVTFSVTKLRPGEQTMTRASAIRMDPDSALSQLNHPDAGHQQLDDRERQQIRRGGDDEHRQIASGPLQHVPRDLRYQHAADRAGHAAEADHGTHGPPGEHVGREREDIRRPALVRCRREADNGHGAPDVADDRC